MELAPLVQHPYFVGEHCETVIGPETDLKFCREAAEFLFTGLTPELIAPEGSKAERERLAKRGNPCTRLLCPDHARALAHDFHGLINDHKVRIERLSVTKLRFRCRNCHIQIAMIWEEAPMSTNPGSLQICPRCGYNNNGCAWPDPEQDYMDWIQEQFNGMPRQLIEMLYAEWPRNDKRYPTFRHYVEAQINEFDSTGDFEAAQEA